MREFLIISLLLAFAVNSGFSQDDNPGLSMLTLNDYANIQNVNCSLTGATSYGPAACGTVASDDVFYMFTAVTQGARFSVNAADIDGVIEVMDATYTSVGCVNDIVGIGEEILFVTELIPGDTYYVRIHSADGNSGGGIINLEYCYLPSWTVQPNYVGTSADGDLYRLDDQIRRYGSGFIIVQGTRWRLTNLTTGITRYFYAPNNNANNQYFIFLDDVEDAVATIADPFICYGDDVAIATEVRLEDRYCGFSEDRIITMQPEPTTWLLSAYIGATLDLNSNASLIRTEFTHLDQQIEYEFWNFGELVTSVTSDAQNNIVYLNTVPNLLYGRFYNVRMRVTSCGTTGPWSDFYPFFTSDTPYTQAQAVYCNTTVNASTVIYCNAIQRATSYWWQLIPIAADDPTFTPIGPAQLFESTNNINLSLASLSPSTAYRIAVKPVIANGAQEGDYGTFCQIGTAGSGIGDAISNSSEFDLNPYDLGQSGSANTFAIYPNPSLGDQITIETGQISDGFTQFSIKTMKGKEVFSVRLDNTKKRHQIQLPSSLINGVYVVEFNSTQTKETTKLVVNH